MNCSIKDSGEMFLVSIKWGNLNYEDLMAFVVSKAINLSRSELKLECMVMEKNRVIANDHDLKICK